MLLAVIAQTVLGFLWVVVAGYLSDKIGRDKMFMIGVSMGIFGLGHIAILNTGILWVIFLAIAVSVLLVMTEYGAEAALIAESFTLRPRHVAAHWAISLPLSSPEVDRRL